METLLQKGNASAVSQPGSSMTGAHRGRALWIVLGCLLVAFAKPLWDLGRLAITNELYNYIPLVLLVSGYMAWKRRGSISSGSGFNRGVAASFSAAGLLLAAAYIFQPKPTFPEDALFFSTLSFLCLLVGACMFLLSRDSLSQLAFPLGFAFVAVPVPSGAREALEVLLQHGSAATAAGLFDLTNTTVLRDNLSFRFPGFTLFVAPECSGIRSTLMLLVTSILAAQLLLKRPRNRVLLCLVVLPLGVLRNAFRIFTLAQLCIAISPDMLDSYIHHKGGPIFFGASLVPFFLLIWLLRRSERKRSTVPPGTPEVA